MQLTLHNMQFFLETCDEAVGLHGVKKAETHQPALQGGPSAMQQVTARNGRRFHASRRPLRLRASARGGPHRAGWRLPV
jgi:hypothetical protein